MKIYLATVLSDTTQGASLTRRAKRERLVSYYNISSAKKEGEFEKYVSTGRNDRRRNEDED